MAPEGSGGRRPMLGVVAYLLVPGERRRRAAGHFERAAVEAARGVRALSVPSRTTAKVRDDVAGEKDAPSRGRQRIEID